MAALDWIILLLLLVSLLLGAWRGLAYEVMSVLSWVAAFILARWFAADLAQHLPLSEASETVRYGLAFVLIFVVSVFAGGLLATLVKKFFLSVGLQPADRALGAVFGLLRGMLFLLSATLVIGMTPLKSGQWWQESIGAGFARSALSGLKPVLPQEFGRYIP
jgi:membrane protein required for colicin V production